MDWATNTRLAWSSISAPGTRLTLNVHLMNDSEGRTIKMKISTHCCSIKTTLAQLGLSQLQCQILKPVAMYMYGVKKDRSSVLRRL